jgi:hypothetical protein
MRKTQITLTDQEVDVLNIFGTQLGYPLSKTLRFIISKAVENFVEKNTKSQVNNPELQQPLPAKEEDPKIKIIREIAKYDRFGRTAKQLIENDKRLHPLEWQ